MSAETAGEGERLPARRRTLAMLAVVCGVLLMSLDGAIANISRAGPTPCCRSIS